MGFGEAVSTGLSKYAAFDGRARRSEYWWFFLFLVLVYVGGIAVDAVAGTEPVFTVLALLFLLVPSISVTVRRLHDTDRSGAWYLISFIPLVGPIWLLVLMCLDGKPFDNRFGPSPKYGPSARGAWS